MSYTCEHRLGCVYLAGFEVGILLGRQLTFFHNHKKGRLSLEKPSIVLIQQFDWASVVIASVWGATFRENRHEPWPKEVGQRPNSQLDGWVLCTSAAVKREPLSKRRSLLTRSRAASEASGSSSVHGRGG